MSSMKWWNWETKLKDNLNLNSKMFTKRLKIINNILLMKVKRSMKVLRLINRSMKNKWLIWELNLDRNLMKKMSIKEVNLKEEMIECNILKIFLQKRDKIELILWILSLIQLTKVLIKLTRILIMKETAVYKKKEKFLNCWPTRRTK